MSNPNFLSPVANPFGLQNALSLNPPSFVDIDNDGDLDAFLGNKDESEEEVDILYFENTGNATSPSFAAPQTNPFGLSSTQETYLGSTTFADIDGDGDFDAVIGFIDSEEEGSDDLLFFENTGDPSNPNFAALNLPENNEDVFPLPPTLADIDNDGDLDAFLGIKSPIVYSENTGNANSPSFDFSEENLVFNPFGLPEDTLTALNPTLADIDGDGDLDIFTVGPGEEGQPVIQYYRNTGNASNPNFTTPPLDNPFGLTDVFPYSSPTFADIDEDGDLDSFVVDFTQGDIQFFENDPALLLINGTAVTNPVESYGGNQDKSDTGTVTVLPNNKLNITGNRWQKIEINSTITPNTILNFTFGGSNGEIQGIGFDNNNVVANDDRGRFFQVGGSQSWGIENLSEFIVGQSSDGKDIYSIPVGEFFTGDFEFLTFANDDDQANPDAEAQFSNIELFEAAADLLNISIDEVNQDKEVLSYGGANQNKDISSTVSDNRTELTLVGNGWRKVDITGFEITEDSILSFEFKAQNSGEIQGIGFDNNDVIGNDDRGRFFQVAGTQNWGIDNLADYTDGLADADGFIEYSISVGDFFTGEFDFLTFGNDHDVANPTAMVEFRNISLSSLL